MFFYQDLYYWGGKKRS